MVRMSGALCNLNVRFSLMGRLTDGLRFIRRKVKSFTLDFFLLVGKISQ